MAGLLLFGDTVRSAALRHELPLSIVDPVLFAEYDGRRFVLASPLEADRIVDALPGAEVLDPFALGFRELILNGMSMTEADREVAARAVERIGLGQAIVPGDFPLALGDRLRDAGVTLLVDDAAVSARRRVKSVAELDGIRAARRAAGAGMAAAQELLAHSGNDGEQLEVQAEDVRAAARAACAAAGAPCPPDVTVTSVWQGTGHDPGHGPLPAGLPIVVDLWPHDEASACWADIARTFVVGPPRTDAIADRERLVRSALDAATTAVRPGVTGGELHALVCDVFEAAGHATQRTAPDHEAGFQFSLGHGVGLEVHEAPYVGLGSHDVLVAGDVLALEPGLYDPELGEVRVEDLVLLTGDGCETLS